MPKNHLETLNTIMHDTLNNDILILGNSRGACAYNPLYIDSVLCSNSRNISVSGQTYIISNLRYRIYRRNNPAPKLLILNIDHIELGSGTLGFERYQYFPYMHYIIPLFSVLSRYKTDKLVGFPHIISLFRDSEFQAAAADRK